MSAGFARPATHADIPAIITCSIAAWSQRLADPSLLPPPDLLQAGWQQYFNAPPAPGRYALVATSNNEAVGWLMSDLGADPDIAHINAVEILDITIHPDHRRHGHGSRLLHALADSARTQGMQALQMWFLADDPAMAAFLAGQGFAADGARRELADIYDAGDAATHEVRVLADITNEGS